MSIFKRYFVALATSVLRHILTGAGAWFVANNIGSSGQWDSLLLGLASLLVGGTAIVVSKYRVGDRVRMALALPAGTPTRVLDQAMLVKDDAARLIDLAKQVRGTRPRSTL